MDNASSTASANKTGEVELAMPLLQSTAGAEQHLEDFTERHTRDSPAQVTPPRCWVLSEDGLIGSGVCDFRCVCGSMAVCFIVHILNMRTCFQLLMNVKSYVSRNMRCSVSED